MRVTAAVDSRSSQKTMGMLILLREIASEGAGRLGARALRAVHVERQAEDDADRLVLGDQLDRGAAASSVNFCRLMVSSGVAE